MNKIDLIKLAFEAREKNYTPYSNFGVGAAILGENGKVYQGCNVENASYGATVCAERTAAVKAVYDGCTKFAAIAIVGFDNDAPEEKRSYAFPCGICRQFLREYSSGDMKVYVAKNIDEFYEGTLSDLLPNSFGPEDLA